MLHIRAPILRYSRKQIGINTLCQVLAAFTITALLTFGAIVIGYFTDSLPEEHLNSLDYAVTDRFSASPLGKALGYVRSHFIPVLKQCFFIRHPESSKKRLTKARREVAFEKFILALSDQQLVTGIAILVAIFANHCRVSVYELNVAVSLAWFSSTTHLATLDVLHRYFRQNPVVRNWRMLGMISVLILLIPALVLESVFIEAEPQIPMQCARYFPTDYLEDGIGASSSTFIILYLCVGYSVRLYKTFTHEDGSMVDPELLLWKALLRMFSNLTKPERQEIVENAIRICNTRRTIHIEDLLDSFSKRRRFFRRFGLCFGAYSRSFLQLIAALFFFLSFGVSQVVATRWGDYQVDLERDSNTMEFGQIVPLILLVIPLLAAAEIFYGMKHN